MKIYLDRKKLDRYRGSCRPTLDLKGLAATAGIPYSTFHAQYSGKNGATLSIALPLAMLMEVSVEEILRIDWEEDK